MRLSTGVIGKHMARRVVVEFVALLISTQKDKNHISDPINTHVLRVEFSLVLRRHGCPSKFTVVCGPTTKAGMRV